MIISAVYLLVCCLLGLLYARRCPSRSEDRELASEKLLVSGYQRVLAQDTLVRVIRELWLRVVCMKAPRGERMAETDLASGVFRNSGDQRPALRSRRYAA